MPSLAYEIGFYVADVRDVDVPALGVRQGADWVCRGVFVLLHVAGEVNEAGVRPSGKGNGRQGEVSETWCRSTQE